MKNIWQSKPVPKNINDTIRVCWDANTDPKNRHIVMWASHNKDWCEKECPYLLTIKDARKLRDWLNNFLFEVGG